MFFAIKLTILTKTDFDGGQDIVIAVRPGDGQERYLFDLVQAEHGQGGGHI